MTGMKSGTGDDLWGDEEEEQAEEAESEPPTEREPDAETADDSVSGSASHTTTSTATSTSEMPYILQRAMGDHSTQWKRENRLTFFVRDHVSAGERELVAAVESDLGRDVPVFDVREAAYLVAQEHEADVVEKLREMGYGYDD